MSMVTKQKHVKLLVVSDISVFFYEYINSLYSWTKKQVDQILIRSIRDSFA